MRTKKKMTATQVTVVTHSYISPHGARCTASPRLTPPMMCATSPTAVRPMPTRTQRPIPPASRPAPGPAGVPAGADPGADVPAPGEPGPAPGEPGAEPGEPGAEPGEPGAASRDPGAVPTETRSAAGSPAGRSVPSPSGPKAKAHPEASTARA